MDEGVYILFDSVHYVLRAEKILRKAGLSVRVRPVPRRLSSDCGVCLLLESGDFNQALAALPDNTIPNAAYKIVGKEQYQLIWSKERTE